MKLILTMADGRQVALDEMPVAVHFDGERAGDTTVCPPLTFTFSSPLEVVGQDEQPAVLMRGVDGCALPFLTLSAPVGVVNTVDGPA